MRGILLDPDGRIVYPPHLAECLPELPPHATDRFSVVADEAGREIGEDDPSDSGDVIHRTPEQEESK